MGIFNIFKRTGKIVEANANSALDKIEDPTVMVTQALRDLNVEYTNAVNAQATFKSAIIKLKEKKQEKETEKSDWEDKAGRLQDRIDSDETKKDQIEPLIITALENSKRCATEVDLLSKNIAGQELKYNALVEKIKQHRDLISKTEDELESIKTRQVVAKASVDINKELSNNAGIDSTKELIHRMEDKVSQQESLAEAWSGVDSDSATNETKINELLKTETPASSADLLASFRANRKTTV